MLFFAPSDGERVTCPHAERGHVKVKVLASAELPGTCHAEGDSDCFSGKSFDLSLGTTATDVVAKNQGHANGTLEDPDDDDTEDEDLLGKGLEVNPDGNDGDDGEYDVNMQEGFVERMTDCRWGVQHQHDECASGL